MNSPSFNEFQSIIEYLSEELTGSQLQEVQSTADGLVLGFYRYQLQTENSPKSVWLVLDLDKVFPFVGLFDHNPWPKIKKTTPVGLFVNSNFKNHHIEKIAVVANYGRVAEFHFKHPDINLKMELRLIPKQANLVLVADRKIISWDKVKELSEVHTHLESEYLDKEQRSVHFIFKQWLNRRSKIKVDSAASEQSKTNPYNQWVNQRQKEITKKEKALLQIDQQIAEMNSIPWSEMGEYLKVYGLKNIKLEWTPHLDLAKKASHNIEKCFTKMKQAATKTEGAILRKVQLKKEIAAHSDQSEDAFKLHLDRLVIKQSGVGQRKASDSQFRRLNIPDSTLITLMGKSAQDNLQLLRQAKAWDLWIHLKDYPSAYAIMQKAKEQKVSDLAITQASQWLVKESLKNKKNLAGAKLSVVITECRHVRPIKGDRLGRVTYHHARELLITV